MELTQVTAWPNNLGFDVVFYGESLEVWRGRNAFRVFSENRVGLIYFSTTSDPARAAQLTLEFGLLRSTLDNLEYRDAESLYYSYFQNLAQKLEAKLAAGAGVLR